MIRSTQDREIVHNSWRGARKGSGWVERVWEGGPKMMVSDGQEEFRWRVRKEWGGRLGGECKVD